MIRWQHPERGVLLPGSFLPVAEKTRLIAALGTLVLKAACADLRNWRAARAVAPHWVAVNVAADQFMARDFVDEVDDAVRGNGRLASDLVLEITEGVLLQDTPMLQIAINNLKAMGVSLVVDDFGTGFAGLEYFRRYGVDGLKIDRSFIGGLTDTQERRS